MGNVCCVDPACLNGTDYSSVRVVLMLGDSQVVPPNLVVRNFDGGFASLARLRVIRSWEHPVNDPASVESWQGGQQAQGVQSLPSSETPGAGGGGEPSSLNVVAFLV